MPAKQKLVYDLFYDGFTLYRESYNDIINGEFKKNYDDQFDINEFLLKILPKIKLLDSSLKIESLITKFFIEIRKSAVNKFPPEMITKWKDKAKEKIDGKNVKI